MDYPQALQHLNNLLSLPSAGQLLQLNSQTVERVYEAYAAALIARAVRQAGGTAEMRGILNAHAAPITIVFRGSPGFIHSRHQNFAYWKCLLRGKEFEIHLDVTYSGSSGARHEIDVSVLDHSLAERARRNSALPKTGSKLLMAFECKFYDTIPGVMLGRTFVGLIQDCSSQQLCGFAANRTSDNLARYFSKSTRPEPFLDLVPGDQNSEARFVSTVEQKLRKWAP